MAERRSPAAIRWGAMLLVLLGALMLGSGLLDRQAPTTAERIAALEASIKCPSCQDLSVAQSTAPSSLAVRREIAAGVRAGRSDDEIVASLRSRYGSAVDLTPSGGISVLLWLIPALLAVGVVIVVLLALRRRRLGDDGR